MNWSPRADRILFSRDESGGTIYIGSTDGSEHAIGPGRAADWSPDGSKIAVLRWPYVEPVPFGHCPEQLVTVDLSGRILSGLTPCWLDGSPGPDVIVGTAGPDIAFGGGGPDRMYGGLGNDYLSGGAGADKIYGGPGSDVIDGGPGNDRIFVRDGFRDQVRCGPGFDVVVADSLDSISRDCERVLRR